MAYELKEFNEKIPMEEHNEEFIQLFISTSNVAESYNTAFAHKNQNTDYGYRYGWSKLQNKKIRRRVAYLQDELRKTSVLGAQGRYNQLERILTSTFSQVMDVNTGKVDLDKVKHYVETATLMSRMDGSLISKVEVEGMLTAPLAVKYDSSTTDLTDQMAQLKAMLAGKV